MYGTQCAMQCNDRYDIPLGVGGIATFTGLFTCSTVAGKWSPLLTVPGCTCKYNIPKVKLSIRCWMCAD